MALLPALGRQSQEDHEFKPILYDIDLSKKKKRLNIGAEVELSSKMHV
jgi:hypothetical protein